MTDEQPDEKSIPMPITFGIMDRSGQLLFPHKVAYLCVDSASHSRYGLCSSSHGLAEACHGCEEAFVSGSARKRVSVRRHSMEKMLIFSNSELVSEACVIRSHSEVNKHWRLVCQS